MPGGWTLCRVPASVCKWVQICYSLDVGWALASRIRHLPDDYPTIILSRQALLAAH